MPKVDRTNSGKDDESNEHTTVTMRHRSNAFWTPNAFVTERYVTSESKDRRRNSTPPPMTSVGRARNQAHTHTRIHHATDHETAQSKTPPPPPLGRARRKLSLSPIIPAPPPHLVRRDGLEQQQRPPGVKRPEARLQPLRDAVVVDSALGPCRAR